MSVRRYTLLVVAAYAAVVALLVLGLLGRQPYDDAWFFKRFAHSFLEHGVFAWNVEDGPVHGNTSQVFQLLAVPVYAVVGDYYALGMRLILAVALVGAVLCLLRVPLPAASEGGESATSAGTGGAIAPAALVYASPIALFTALTGMETALVLLALAGFWVLLRRCPPEGRWQMVAPLGMLVVYLLRPDAVLLAGIAWAWDRAVIRRRLAWKEALLGAGLFSAAMLALWAYYGTALPLSFYLKSGHLTVYSESFIELSKTSKKLNVALLLVVVLPALYAACQRIDRRNGGLLLGAAAYVSYHYLSTIEVMGGHARFYAPVLPWVAAAALSGADGLCDRRRIPLHLVFLIAYSGLVWLLWRDQKLPDDTIWIIERVPGELYVGYVASSWVAILAAWWRPRAAMIGALGTIAISLWVAYPTRTFAAPPDSAYVDAQLRQRSGFREIKKVKACLGESITLYHSEIGLPGVMFPNAQITDLAALMTPDLVFGRATFDEYCARESPEVIYLPHRVYDTLNEEIRAGDCIRDYKEVRRDSSSPLYIRRDLLASYRACRGG